MTEEMEVGCARPTGGPVGESVEEESKEVKAVMKKEVSSMIQVGKKHRIFQHPVIKRENLFQLNFLNI